MALTNGLNTVSSGTGHWTITVPPGDAIAVDDRRPVDANEGERIELLFERQRGRGSSGQSLRCMPDSG